MALQTAYKRFLASPNASFLAPNVSLHYITTLVTFNGSADIIKHLNGQNYELQKKEEKFLDVVESTSAIAVEIHTCIEFLAGGGAYLPSLDDNFLADRTVTLPIIHIVTFDASGKITQMRQSWDQGSLLKLIDVIGKTGRNWPIRDGKDQIKLISNSVKSAGKTTVDPVASNEEVPEHIRSRGNSTNVTRDPHASLALFAPREKVIQEVLPPVVAPKASAKPPQRNYNELFVGNESDGSPTKATYDREDLPPKNPRAPKAGAGKNYGPSRLFDADEEGSTPNLSTEKLYRPNPARYQHFDFAEGGDSDDHSKAKPQKEVQAAKHGSQWNFDDFKTPQKVIPTKVLRNNAVRHWGNSDDENMETPVMVKRVDKPRKDAETHFEFIDDGTPDGERRVPGRPRGQGQNNGLGLYRNDMFDSDGAAPVGASKPSLANVKERGKIFDPHFSMTDDSPASTPISERIPEDRAKAVKMMDANWSAYDESPNQKENVPANGSRSSNGAVKTPLVESTNNNPKGIMIAGDGMGGKKGVNHQTETSKGIVVGGDGMGGKKGLGRQWGFGDESDGEEADGINKPSKFRTGKTTKQQATGGDFWDF